MADGFHPLCRGTIMMFGSLEFMSLGSGYDMVLLPPRGDDEPHSEPIPPQPVRGRRSGHHAGAARRGCQRSRIFDPTTEARVRPALPPHIPHQIAHSSGSTRARGRARGIKLRSTDQQGIITTSCSSPIKGEGTAPARSQKGDKGASSSCLPPPTDGGETATPPELPFGLFGHLRLFREHFLKCVRGSSRAPSQVYPGPHHITAHFVVPRGPHLRR